MQPMSLIKPDWPAPPCVMAFASTRAGGYSEGRFGGLNLGDHVGDDADKVALNRKEFTAHLPDGTTVQWLSQNHGTHVTSAGVAAGSPEADGIWSNSPGYACTVMTADCLPVLFSARDGRVVAAAHAGWRGLCAGILESCINSLGVRPQSLMAWMGPAIGPGAFEVGAEVRQQFVAAASPVERKLIAHCFEASGDSPGHYHADLYGLARLRMRAAGVADIYGGEYCTYSDPSRFYSFRRDGQTGRMATTIALNPQLK